jgi:2-keto-3-deoxy-L-rhamnonate aldolase RhmA
MRPNPVKRALAAGEVSLGTMVFEFCTPGIGRIAANAGAEFVIFDQEHTGWGVDTIRPLIAATRATDTIPIVRVPATGYHLIAQPLDAGAMGIMVPMVESEDQAYRIVQSAKYPPHGRRGAAFAIAHDDYVTGDIVNTMQSANDEVLLIAQIETESGVESADAIASMPGIDVLWIGHFDLTNSLGIPGQFDHPAYRDAVATVLAACNRHRKVPGIMAADPATARAAIDDGFRAIAYGGDLWIYGNALRDGLTAVRDSG